MKKEMKLTRRIPAKTITVRFEWAYKNFSQCTDKYIEIRNSLPPRRKGTQTSCDWCRRKFERNEWFALASPLPKQEGPKRNWALCHDCADNIGAIDRPKRIIK